MSGSDLVCDCLHLEALKEFKLIHESFEWEGPSVTKGLEVLCLVNINIECLESAEMGNFGFCRARQ